MPFRFPFPRGVLLPACGTVFIALTFAAPPAIARPLDPGSRAPAGVPAAPAIEQDTRSPDTRDVASPNTWSDVAVALAQQAYYSSYGDPTPLTTATTTAAAHAGEGIAWVPFARTGRTPSAGERAVFCALIGALGAGSGLYLMYARRRPDTGLAT